MSAGSGAPRPLRFRAELPWLASVFFPLCLLYGLTMPRTVTLEDPGLFITTAHFWGIAHPPGYPLYTILAKLFTWLPVGSVALRVHWLSATAGAAACALLYLCSLLLGTGRIAALAAALVYGVSASFWSLATVAEVYALNALFFFGVLALCLRLAERFDLRTLRVAAFFYGLSLANHWPLMVLSSGSFAILLAQHWRDVLRHLRSLAGWVVLGLTPYLYLPIRSAFDPYLTAFGPVRSFADFWWYVSRKGYAQIDAREGAGLLDTYSFVNLFFDRLTVELGPIAFAAAVGGILVLWIRFPRRIFWCLVLALSSSSILFRLIAWGKFGHVEAEQYLAVQLIPFGILAILASLLAEPLARSWRLCGIPRAALVGAAGAVIVAAALVQNLAANDRREDRFALDYAEVVLHSLPEEAVLFLQGGVDTGPIAYAHLVEGVRPDVTLFSQNAHLFGNRIFDPRSDPPETIFARVRSFVEQKGVVWAPFLSPALQASGVEIRPEETNGLVYRISLEPGGAAIDPAALADVAALLDREHAGQYSASWESHKKRILQSLCKALILQGIEHPVFSDRPECRMLQAIWLHGEGELARARDIDRELIEQIPFLYFGPEQWNIVYAHYVDAELVLDPGLLADPARLRALVDLVAPIVAGYPSCENAMVRQLLRIHREARAPVDVRLPALAVSFGGCPKLRAEFERALRGLSGPP